jgi:hypothetical protein
LRIGRLGGPRDGPTSTHTRAECNRANVKPAQMDLKNRFANNFGGESYFRRRCTEFCGDEYGSRLVVDKSIEKVWDKVNGTLM